MSSGRSERPRIVKFVVGPLLTNCYIVYGERSRKGILIDPGAHDPGVTEYIRSNGLEVMYTLNTHGHADHIQADAAFGFPVLIHRLDGPCLWNPLANLSIFAGGSVPRLRAERLLEDGDTVDVGDLKFKVIHTPGHTPGGISILCEDMLFSGDTLFSEGVGRTDIPGGNQKALTASIREKLLLLPDQVKVYPGHGPETTIGHERKYNPFL